MEAMKVLLIYPDIIQENKNWPGYYYNGIGNLSACLKKNGHQVSLVHILNFDIDSILKRILSDNYSVIGFSSTTNQFSYVKTIANKLREKGVKSFLICGGVHATLNPEEVIGVDSLNAICIGEGEEAIVELADSIRDNKDYSNIKNLIRMLSCCQTLALECGVLMVGY